MSFSVSVKAPTKAQAEGKALKELVNQMVSQRAHDRDRTTVMNAVVGAVAALDFPGTDHEVVVEVYGSTNGERWSLVGGESTPSGISRVELTVKAFLREVPAPAGSIDASAA